MVQIHVTEKRQFHRHSSDFHLEFTTNKQNRNKQTKDKREY